LVERLDREIEAADRIFTMSTFHTRSFVESGVPREKLIQVPLGVDLRSFRPLPRGDDLFRVGMLGRIGQLKGLSYMVEAFERLSTSSTAELLLAGPIVGSDAPWRGRPGIRHAGQVPRSGIPAVLAEVDVVVLPSLIDAFGLSALEAMACGKPVIVSENSLADDVVVEGETGYVVPIRDPDAIAGHLERIRDEPGLRARLGAAARRRAEEFSWSRYGDTMAREIGSYLTTHGARPEPTSAR
jgi:glycosyltransferase involved in cell wall biosynthesis